MSDDISEEEWKRRFGLFVLLRVSGLLFMLGGAFVGLTASVRPGGMPAVGIVFVIIGAVDGVVLPVILRKRWKRG